jgi:hypothetical protein
LCQLFDVEDVLTEKGSAGPFRGLLPGAVGAEGLLAFRCVVFAAFYFDSGVAGAVYLGNGVITGRWRFNIPV